MQNDALGTKRRPVPLTSGVKTQKSFKPPHWHLHSFESSAWRIDPNRAGAAAELSMEQLSGLFGLETTPTQVAAGGPCLGRTSFLFIRLGRG